MNEELEVISDPTEDKIKVLAIDDDLFIGKILDDIVSHEYHFKFVQDSPSFWKTMEEFQPEIVLVDLLLKDDNGIDICRKLREEYEDEALYIVILTAHDEIDYIENAYKAGASDYIRKPFVPYEIKAKLSKIERLIKYQRKIFRLFATQKVLNYKLYLLTNTINKGINISSKEELIDSISKINRVILSDYFEIVLYEKDNLISKFSTSQGDFQGVSFEKIQKKTDFFTTDSDDVNELKIKSKSGEITCCIIRKIYFNNNNEGFLIVQKKKEFKQEIRDILNLYLDYVNILGTNIIVKKVMKDEIDNDRSELAKVRSIQVKLLPRLRDIENFDIASTFIPMTEISGDFYDAYKIDEDHLLLVLCDVSGHGVASSYVGSSIRGLLRAASLSDRTLPQVMEELNLNTLNTLTSGISYFASMVVCRINLKNGIVNMVAAGHPPAFYYHSKEQRVSAFENTGTLVGLFDTAEYTEHVFQMEVGDYFLIYTDGITEASQVDADEEFGEERVEKFVLENKEERSIDTVHSLLGDVYEYVDHAPMQDDVTIICVKRTG